ncbi:MAG: alkaline phosphatase family protein [Verrucomicrobia bacterium]|nr:MAG: alkaline phosphatase family protein [Verrucomicrobiota bacterium]
MPLAVINVVGLSASLLDERMPRLSFFAERVGLQSYRPEFPALTCSAQASMLTGRTPAEHGIVGNGWYDRETAEVRFWKQSNAIIHGEKIWDHLRASVPGFSCANFFWWFNMHSTVDFSVTPRPLYPADGRKVFDVHTQPMELRESLKQDLGPFPFPQFWGPAAGIASSQWIAQAARWVDARHAPMLQLIYLPHLDYGLQRDGPDAPQMVAELSAIDQTAGDLIDYYESSGFDVMVLSEYGISAVSKPVHLNRAFREAGWIQIKHELGRETLDAGGSQVFAIADHQVAHVYVKQSSMLDAVKKLLENLLGVERCVPASEIWAEGIGRERAGDLIVIAEKDAWFTYYFWNDDAVAPDYARTIDIHRKPGYDPCELHIDPALRFPQWQIGRHLLKKKIGFRSLLEVIPLDATLVRGSHGRSDVPVGEQPVVIGSKHTIRCAADIFEAMIRHASPA